MRYSELLVLWFLAAVSPGNTALMIMGQSLRGGLKASSRGLLGLMLGHLIFLSLLYLGLNFTGSNFARALPWIQKIGALYLLWVGLRLLLSVLRAPEAHPAESSQGQVNYFFQALLTHLSNPKVLLFAFALLPAYVVAGQTLLPQFLVFAAIILPTELVVMGGYAWIAARGAAQLKLHLRWLDGLAGLLFTLVAIRLLVSGQ